VQISDAELLNSYQWSVRLSSYRPEP